MAFPLKISMTCEKMGGHHQATPSVHLSLLMGSVNEHGLFLYVKAGMSLPFFVPQSLLLSRPHMHALTGSPAPLHALAQTHPPTHGQALENRPPPPPLPPPARALTRRLRATMSGVSL